MIISNQVRCNLCGDTPYSSNRHDFRYCKCGHIAVDGGSAYLRRVGSLTGYTEMSIELPSELVNDMIAACTKAIEDELNHLEIAKRILYQVDSNLAVEQVGAYVAVQEMCESSRNARGIVYGVIRYLRDTGVELDLYNPIKAR